MFLERRRLKLALRLQQRKLQRQGGNEEAVAAIERIRKTSDGLDALDEYIVDIRSDTELPAAGGETILAILTFLIDHWAEILEAILAIVSLFGDDD